MRSHRRFAGFVATTALAVSFFAGCASPGVYTGSEPQIVPPRIVGNVRTAEDLAKYPSYYTVADIIAEIDPNMAARNRALGARSGLTIVDGVTGASFDGLLVTDVVRIEVKNDPSDRAYYGFQGNGGAVEVWTKVGAAKLAVQPAN